MKTSSAIIIILILAALTNCRGPSTITPQPSSTATIPPATPTPAGISLAFVTIDQVDDSMWPVYEGEACLFVARDANELTAFLDYLPGETQARLVTTDFDNSFVLAVFRGIVPGHRYQVTIQAVRVHEGVVSVTAVTEIPTTLIEGEVTSPYHVVQVEQDAVNLQRGVVFVFFLDGMEAQSFSLR